MNELLTTKTIKEEFADLRNDINELRTDMRKANKDIFRWMLFFAITQTIAQVLILSLVINH